MDTDKKQPELSAIWDELHARFGHEAQVGGDQPLDDVGYWANGATDADRIERLAGVFSGKTVLEYGCGLGRISFPVATRCAALTCADASSVALADLRANMHRAKGRPPKQLVQVERLAQLDQWFMFDVIYAWHVVFHLTTVQTISFINDAYARLRPNGVLVFNYCNACHPEYVGVLRHAAQRGTWRAGPFPHTPLDATFLCYFATRVAGFSRAVAESPQLRQPAVVCCKHPNIPVISV